MAKTGTAEASTSQKNEARRQRKKQARREAKIMLKIERAKKDVQKAQKKLTQAQSSLDTDQTHLHDLEAKLQQLRTAQDSQAQETQTPQPGEQPQVPASQTPSAKVPELKPEDFRTQEAVDEAYQEPLLMPTSTPPQADTEAIEAFHTASIIPAEGRPDLSADQAPDTTSPEEQPVILTEPDVSSYLPDEQNASSEAIIETNTPGDTTSEDSTSTLWQDENQSLTDSGNEEPELSNNPISSSSEKDETPVEAPVGASDENKEENLQA